MLKRLVLDLEKNLELKQREIEQMKDETKKETVDQCEEKMYVSEVAKRLGNENEDSMKKYQDSEALVKKLTDEKMDSTKKIAILLNHIVDEGRKIEENFASGKSKIVKYTRNCNVFNARKRGNKASKFFDNHLNEIKTFSSIAEMYIGHCTEMDGSESESHPTSLGEDHMQLHSMSYIARYNTVTREQ